MCHLGEAASVQNLVDNFTPNQVSICFTTYASGLSVHLWPTTCSGGPLFIIFFFAPQTLRLSCRQEHCLLFVFFFDSALFRMFLGINIWAAGVKPQPNRLWALLIISMHPQGGCKKKEGPTSKAVFTNRNWKNSTYYKLKQHIKTKIYQEKCTWIHYCPLPGKLVVTGSRWLMLLAKP